MRQEDQKCKVMVSFIMSSRPTRAKKEERSKRGVENECMRGSVTS